MNNDNKLGCKIKFPYYVNQILLLKSGNFIIASRRDIIYCNKNYKIKFKKEKVTNNYIKDMCLIDQNTFAVCSSGDIIILKILENNFKIVKKYINPHGDHWVCSIIFSKNNILISSSIYDDKIKIWDILNESNQPIQVLNHDADGLLEWDENIFISSGYSKTKIWNKIKDNLNYQLMNTFYGIDIYRNNGIKKYDDNSIILCGLNYITYIINIKTMEATKKIFREKQYDIYSILNLKKYLILGGNNRNFSKYLDEIDSLNNKKCKNEFLKKN